MSQPASHAVSPAFNLQIRNDELPTLQEIRDAASLVYLTMPATPDYSWPLLNERVKAEVWVKHENHTPVGAFKVRGGLVYMDWLRSAHPEVTTIVSATRGNHGQSLAFAAAMCGLRTVIVTPFGNSVEKNRAMRALGAELVEHGSEFAEASDFAARLADENGWHKVPSFHRLLVTGVATYALEFLSAHTEMETMYVPIGMGSGICGAVAARDALRLKTKIVGVVSKHAPAYAQSFAAGKPVEHAVSTELADGVACRKPDVAAVSLIAAGVERILQVTDEEVAEAMRIYFADTHNVAEGAGAVGLAGLLQDQPGVGACVGTVLSGGNVDTVRFAKVLAQKVEPTAESSFSRNRISLS